MKAMIFAAGLGTRLKPITDNIPKALLPLNGKTLLQYQIDKLRNAGITQIVINVHHFPDMIIDYLAQNNNFGCDILISDEREQLLDTGGGLLKASTLLGNDDNILACNVDILSNIDLPTLISSHSNNNLATLVVSQRDTQRYLLFDDSQKMVGWTNIATGEIRPQDSNLNPTILHLLAFSGMQILSPKIFPLLETIQTDKGEKFSMIDAYLSLCRTHNIYAFIPQNYRMMDVGKINQLSQAEEFAKNIQDKTKVQITSNLEPIRQ